MNLLEAIQNAGVVGAGGAGFPTHVKLKAKAEWFIVNAAECEPLIETDKYLCRTFADRIVAAAAVVAEHLQASHTVIALKSKYRAEIEALQTAVRQAGARIDICEMDVFYPAGDEQSMVQWVTGKTVPERGLPLDVGAVVDNVGTLLNIYDMMVQGQSVSSKYLSVVGEVREPVMLHVPVGTPITACIEAAAPTVKEYAVILGGPMMGRVVASPQAIGEQVVTKTTGNIIVLPPDHYLIQRDARPFGRISAQARAACIQCRMCTDLCPRYLLGHQIRPHLVMRNLYRADTITTDEEFLRAFGDAANCCSCGVCEMFACPMGLSPRKVNEYAKNALRQRGLQPARSPAPQARPELGMRRIPTQRLIARLGLAKYGGLHATRCIELHPQEVFVPFSQHIGKPAQPVCQVGDRVEKGDLIARAAENALSANVHAGITGVITEINQTGVRISGTKEG